MARLRVKAIPNAASVGIAGWLGDALKVRVVAPPERGKANTEILAVLADALGLDRRNMQLCSGASSARKVIEVQGVSDAELHQRVARYLRGMK